MIDSEEHLRIAMLDEPILKDQQWHLSSQLVHAPGPKIFLNFGNNKTKSVSGGHTVRSQSTPEAPASSSWQGCYFKSYGWLQDLQFRNQANLTTKEPTEAPKKGSRYTHPNFVSLMKMKSVSWDPSFQSASCSIAQKRTCLTSEILMPPKLLIVVLWFLIQVPQTI